MGGEAALLVEAAQRGTPRLGSGRREAGHGAGEAGRRGSAGLLHHGRAGRAHGACRAFGRWSPRRWSQGMAHRWLQRRSPLRPRREGLPPSGSAAGGLAQPGSAEPARSSARAAATGRDGHHVAHHATAAPAVALVTSPAHAHASRHARAASPASPRHRARRQVRLEQVLGIGGMAAVYLAVHRNGHRVAIKVLHLEASADPGTVARFRREGLRGQLHRAPGRGPRARRRRGRGRLRLPGDGAAPWRDPARARQAVRRAPAPARGAGARPRAL